MSDKTMENLPGFVELMIALRDDLRTHCRAKATEEIARVPRLRSKQSKRDCQVRARVYNDCAADVHERINLVLKVMNEELEKGAA